ncbi:MAG: VanZ family protein [Myxococcota bacterium]
MTGDALPEQRLPSARQIVLAWTPVVAYLVLIWVLSSMSTLQIPLSRIPLRDKGLHIIEYAVLGLLVVGALRVSFPSQPHIRIHVLAIALTCLCGVVDEVHQAFVPYRQSDVRDLVADAVGAVLGVATGQLILFVHRRKSGYWASPKLIEPASDPPIEDSSSKRT